MQSNTLKGFFALLISGALFGISGPLAKLLADSFTAYEAVFLRFGIATICALVLLLILKERFSVKHLPKKTLLLFAVTFPISVILFVLSVFSTKVVLAIFTYYIADAICSFIIGGIWLKEKPTPKKLLSLGILLISLILLTDPFQSFTLELGIIFGLLAGVTNAISSYYKKILKGTTSVLNLTLIQTIAGIAVALIAIIIAGDAFAGPIAAGDIWIAVLYGALLLGITYLLIYGFQHFDLNLGSIVVSSELIFGPIFALLLLHEGITTIEMIGGLLVIVAIAVPYIGKKITPNKHS